MPDFEFSGDSLESLSRDLEESAVRFGAEVDKTLVVIGGELKEAAKAEASKHSKSIPPTVRMDASPGFVEIKAGNANTPLAALYELGNKGKGGNKKDTFRHPVFGQDVFVEQKRYPFLRPALRLDRRNITKRMNAAQDQALRPLLRSDE